MKLSTTSEAREPARDPCRAVRGFHRVLAAGSIAALANVATLLAAAPVVDSLAAIPAAAAPGGSVVVSLSAHDPDCASGSCTAGCGQYVRSDLTTWSASGGTITSIANGVSSSPYAASATWQAPSAEGVYTISIGISDSGTFLCGGRQSASAQLLITVTTRSGQPPSVDALTVAPGTVLPEGQALATCTASDPDGGTPLIAWRTDRGTIVAESASTARFTAPAAAVGLATITCMATDSSGLAAERSVEIAITGALAERSLDRGLASPRRLAVDDRGQVLVADPRAASIVTLDFSSGQPIERLSAPGISSLAVDWADRLLVGGTQGAEVRGRDGKPLRPLGGMADGPVADVAVDREHKLYGVLYRDAGGVAVYDESGNRRLHFGIDAQGAGLLKAPTGLAASTAGEWVVADSGNGCLRVFDASGTLLRTIGAPGGSAGEFVQLDDVAVDAGGRIYASDSFQDWIEIFEPDGTLREVVGRYGEGPAGLRNASGLALVESYGWLLAASQNGGAVRAFRLRLDSTTPPGASVSLTPATLDFGARQLGSAGAPLAATLRNTGGGALGVLQIATPSGFTSSSDCPAVLAPAASCTIQVAFAPDRSGAFAASLAVLTSASPAPFAVALAGSAFSPPQLVLSPLRLDFPDQPVGTLGAPLPVTAINAGGVSLGLASRVSGDYALIDGCGPSLAAGASCVLAVYFAPRSEGDPLTGALTVTPSAGAVGRVALVGRSQLLLVEPRPRGLLFPPPLPVTGGPPQSVQMANVGSATVRLGPSSLAGAGAADFLIERDDCSGELAPGDRCTLDIRFAPAAAGVTNAELVLPVDLVSPVRVGLVGGVTRIFADGFERGDARNWDVGTVDFGACTSATCVLSLTWSNDGPQDVAVGALEWTLPGAGPFWAVSDTCSSRLLPLFGSCTLQLGFSPPARGSFAARLLIRTGNGIGIWRELSLTGVRP